MTLPTNKRNYASMSGNNATIATITNDGAPQVSILANASMKRCQERNRQSRLLKNSKGMGVGKKYPSVGTHHRSTKHVWQLSELAELSAAYKAHHTTMPCWNIANMLYYSFGEQLRHDQDQDQDQDQATFRTHLPTIQAIQAKLMDCISLQHADTFGYASRPTQAHKQVWEHLELAEKHRDMLAKMTAAVSEPMQHHEQLQEQDEMQTSHAVAPVWNIHPTSFYTPDAEIEAAEPPTKRRKTETTTEEQQDESPAVSAPTAAPTMSKADFDTGIEELSSLLEDVDQARRTEKANIQNLVHQIREHNTQIGELLGSMQDAQAEIFQHRRAITHIMEQIESIISPVPLPTPSAAGSAAPTTTPVCAKCTKTIEGELGGFSVHYADPSQPQGTYECYECAPMSPSARAYFEMGRAIEEENGYALDYDSDMDEYPNATERYDFETESLY